MAARQDFGVVIKRDSNIRLVILQFSFSNEKVVPACVRRIPDEKILDALSRKSKAAKDRYEEFIDRVENISLFQLINDLPRAGYVLVDALYQNRIDHRSYNRYHMVRFVFAHPDFAFPHGELKQEESRNALFEICKAMWRVRCHMNWYEKEGEEREGQQFMVGFNMEVRRPLFNPDGTPIMVWQRDDQGEKVGDAPLPIRPDFYIRLEDDGELVLVET